MNEPKMHARPVALDWWLLVAIAQTMLLRDRGSPDAPRHTSGIPEREGYRFNLGDPVRIGHTVGVLRFAKQNDPNETLVSVEVDPGYYDYCLRLMDHLELIANTSRVFLADQPTAERAIQTYYRTKAAGGKVTLRQIAEQTGFSYDYLRKAKRRYDAAGGWGSKKEPVVQLRHDETID